MIFFNDKNTIKNLENLIPEVSKREFFKKIFDILGNVNANKIVFVDTKDKSNITDYLIICQGNSQTHCKSIAEKIEYNLKKIGHFSLGIEGEREGNWVLLDYGEIIIHVFHPEIRKYYNLEELYSSQQLVDFKKTV